LPAKTATAASKSEAAPVARRRRVPGWAIALAGLVVGVGYGLGLERMMFGPPLVMLALGGMTLALCGLALWRVIDPLTRPDVGLALDPRGRGRARELEREKQAVLKAIKEIELDHQMRKIADPDYRDMIERYRGRAMRLISEIEAGDNFRELIERELKDRLAIEAVAGPAAAVSAAREPDRAADSGPDSPPLETPVAPSVSKGCPACGGGNDDDAQFCKKCGVKLAS
jgi:hypothetical protein